ncbi:MAG: DUF1667 domain-containing protein [Bacillota bacterium]
MTTTEVICTSCPKGCRITVEAEGDEIKSISGYDCPQGKDYAIEEFKNPTRILPSTIIVKNGEFPLVPVKTARPIPKSKLLPAMKEIAQTTVEAPVELGEVLIEDLVETGVSVVATRNINQKKDKTA